MNTQTQHQKTQQQNESTKPKTVDLSPLLQFRETRNALVDRMASTGKTRALLGDIVKPRFNPDEDGVTHINISSIAKTELGKLLDVNAQCHINHPDLGTFQCLGGLWYYISGDRDDSFRTVYGKKCVVKGKKTPRKYIDGFKTIIAEATWIKVILNPNIMNLLMQSELPLVSYFVQGEVSVITAEHKWLTHVLEECRRCLKMNQQIVNSFTPTEENPKFNDELLVSPNFDFIAEMERKQTEEFFAEKKKFSKSYNKPYEKRNYSNQSDRPQRAARVNNNQQ